MVGCWLVAKSSKIGLQEKPVSRQKCCWVKERIQIDICNNILNLGYRPPLLAFVVDVEIPVYPQFAENVVQPVDELAAPRWGKEMMGLESKQRSHYF
jgi:hypothetical protein